MNISGEWKDGDEPGVEARRGQRAGVKRGMTHEEWMKERHDLSKSGYELNCWGRVYNMSVDEAHTAMWDRMPGVQQYRIPRTVGERLDLSMNAKMLFGVLTNFPSGIIAYRWELGGLCGLSAYGVSKAVKDLERLGMIEVTRRWRRNIRRSAPSRYKLIQPPNRFKEKAPPAFTKIKIDNLEEKLCARFNDIKP